MKIIAFANHKGGVGKTAAVSAVSSILANEYGKRILMIDLDAQSNLTLNYLERIPERTIHDAFKERQNIPVVQINGNLSLVPSTLDMITIESDIVSQYRREYILNELLAPIADAYDYLMIDCPPALGITTTNAMAIADHVFVPMLADGLSVYGLAMMNDYINKTRQINGTLELTGVFFSRFDKRRSVTNAIEQTVRQQYGDKVLSTVIRENVAVVEAFLANKDIITYAPISNAAQDYKALTKEIIEKIK